MRNQEMNSAVQQRGAVLVVTMLFLIAISVLAVTAMQSGNIGLQMAQNEESRIAATQGAQALADAIASNPASTPVVGDSNFTICTAGEANCDRTDLPIADATLSSEVANGFISARVRREGSLFRPPPRSVESSIDKFNSASFEVITTFDRTDEQLGRQQIAEGVLVLVPRF